ncbi:MAG: septum formation initiator family protein [Bifidobacteriaceae bacterium]|jgi:cell division protein FtsB|nr:septum formation initiator family protein [Bifidobacteriaceae bacterium]
MEAIKADDAERERAAVARHRRNIGFRIATLGLLVMFVFALTFPTMRLYLAEQQELRAARAEAAVARETTSELKAQLRRWDDPAFVQAQARERLSYVMPGDVAFKVVDPENAPSVDRSGDSAVPDQTIDIRPSGAEGTEQVPWYTLLWESAVRAGGESAP